MRCTAFAPLALLLAIALSSPARAADTQRAGQLFRAAQQAADQGELPTAIRAFRAAYRAAPHPNVLFALAQVLRRQYVVDGKAAHVREAIDLYRRFIAARPRSRWRPGAQAYLVQLLAIALRLPPTSAPAVKAAATELLISSPTVGARISIDGAGAAGSSRGMRSPAIRIVRPGKHRILISAPGHRPQQRELLAVRGRLIVAEVTLQPLPGALRVVAGIVGARVFVDGRFVGSTPFEAGGFPVGDHRIAVASRGRLLWRGRTRVESDRTALVLAELAPSGQRQAAWLTAGGGALLALAGGVVGALALGSNGQVLDAPTHTNSERSARDDQLARRNGLATASTTLFIGAAAALVTAAGLYFFDQPDPPSAQPKSERRAMLPGTLLRRGGDS